MHYILVERKHILPIIYDKAAEKFKKFTTLYKSDSRRADSMYLLTIASHKSGRHMGSIVLHMKFLKNTNQENFIRIYY